MQQDLNPASLPAGTHVGPWLLGRLLGRGTFGTVYLAQGAAPEASGPAALKLAHAPHDERFAREVGLLSRLRHPCIPRLLGHGQWQSPAGHRYPYVAMELLEGMPLYEWAQAHAPSSRQLLRLLAGVARALEAVHAAGGVHRDVKGSNVLVRGKDGRGFLIDFGSCHYQGASRLTWQAYPPGTIAYRAPEAYAYAHERLKSRGTLPPYAPKPADDLFALGVTAWRLVVGDYPPASIPQDTQVPEVPPQPAHELNPRCSPALSLLISRMLSPLPEARGTARELAAALEKAARREGRGADVPLFLEEGQQSVAQHSFPSAAAANVSQWRLSPRVAAVGLTAALAGTAAVWVASIHNPVEPTETQAMGAGEEEDGGTTGLGDAVLTAPAAPRRAPSGLSPIALDMPSKPLKGQERPDADGRCPDKMQAAINGGCWYRLKGDPKDCGARHYVYRGECYMPSFSPERPATSNPADAPDAGAR